MPMAKKFGTHTERSTKQAASLCRPRRGAEGWGGEGRCGSGGWGAGTMADNKRHRCHKMAAECGAARKDAARFLAPAAKVCGVALANGISTHTDRAQSTHTVQHTHTHRVQHTCSLWRVSVGKWQTTPKRKCLAGISRRRRQATAGTDNVICFRLRALCTCLVSCIYPLSIA